MNSLKDLLNMVATEALTGDPGGCRDYIRSPEELEKLEHQDRMRLAEIIRKPTMSYGHMIYKNHNGTL